MSELNLTQRLKQQEELNRDVLEACGKIIEAQINKEGYTPVVRCEMGRVGELLGDFPRRAWNRIEFSGHSEMAERASPEIRDRLTKLRNLYRGSPEKPPHIAPIGRTQSTYACRLSTS